MYLEVKNLTKNYNNSVAVINDLSFSVKKGQIISFVGESGSGKSTFLKCLSGLEKPNSGIVSLNDQVINGENVFITPQKRKIGYVFQDFALFPHLNANDNAVYSYDQNDSNIILKDEVMHMLNLEKHKDKYPHELSGGQQQRVALARALLMQPKLLLMDEPFSGLDRDNNISAQELINDSVSKLKIPAILVTHSLEHLDVINTNEIIKI